MIWTNELKRLGFRDRGNRYWRCDRGYGLNAGTHLSLYLWTEHARLSPLLACYEFAEFHVTFEVPRHNLHFYYHEFLPVVWQAGGHTSTVEIARLGLDVSVLRESADRIAGNVIAAFGGRFEDRAVGRSRSDGNP